MGAPFSPQLSGLADSCRFRFVVCTVSLHLLRILSPWSVVTSHELPAGSPSSVVKGRVSFLTFVCPVWGSDTEPPSRHQPSESLALTRNVLAAWWASSPPGGQVGWGGSGSGRPRAFHPRPDKGRECECRLSTTLPPTGRSWLVPLFPLLGRPDLHPYWRL